MDFNKEIKKLIIDAGISRYELAEKSGINYGTLSMTLAGERAWTLQKIKATLKVFGYELTIKKVV